MDITTLSLEKRLELAYRNGYKRYDRTTMDDPKMTYEEWVQKREAEDTEFP